MVVESDIKGFVFDKIVIYTYDRIMIPQIRESVEGKIHNDIYDMNNECKRVSV